MDTILTITLASLVIGFFYRGEKLLDTIRGVYYAASLSKENTPTRIQFLSASEGCIGCMCFSFFAISFGLPIYLFFKTEWWISIAAILIGLTFGNLSGYVIERVLKLPNHQTFDNGLFSNSLLNTNSIELSLNEKLYKKAFHLLIFYNIISLIMSLIVIIQNEMM